MSARIPDCLARSPSDTAGDTAGQLMIHARGRSAWRSSRQIRNTLPTISVPANLGDDRLKPRQQDDRANAGECNADSKPPATNEPVCATGDESPERCVEPPGSFDRGSQEKAAGHQTDATPRSRQPRRPATYHALHRTRQNARLMTLRGVSPRAVLSIFSAIRLDRALSMPSVHPDTCGVINTLRSSWNGCVAGEVASAEIG